MKKILNLFFLLIIVVLLVACKNNEHVHNFVLVKGVESTCVELGHSDYYQCECGEIIDKVEYEEYAEHKYRLINEAKATATSARYEEYECDVCHDNYKVYNNGLNRNDEDMNNIKILLIGNSLTNYNTLMNCFKGIITGEGYKVTIDKCAYGNQYLYDYIEGPDGDYYSSLFEKVFYNRYDLAILQDSENNSLVDTANHYDNLRTLTKYLNGFGIKTMIFEPYQNAKGVREVGLNYEESSLISDGKTLAIASELGISVSRVAIAFNKIVKDGKDIPLYNEDGVHPSSFGTYVTALVHMASVYGKRLDGVKYTYNDYIKDQTITWHCENKLEEIDDDTQKYLESVANYATFDFVLDYKYRTSSVGITEEEGTYNGFKKQIEVDNETLGTIKTGYKQTSGTWKVTDNNAFINTTGNAVLMFQDDLITNKDEESVLSFDICVKNELDNSTYSRGILLGSTNKDMQYFDGSDALIIGRYSWNQKPHLEGMRVWDPKKFPNYNYKSGYTFNCGFYFKDLERPVMEVGKTYHIQITMNVNQQRYGYYVNGELYGYVIGYDLPKGGYFGIISYDSNKIEYSNFKFNGKKLVY